MSALSAGRTESAPDWAIHPGEHLSEQLEARGMTQAELARLSGLSPKLISTIISGTNPVTAESAVRLERVLGLKAYIWTGLQARWDLAAAREKEIKVEEQIGDILARFPVRELQARSVLPRSDSHSIAASLYSFLGIGGAGSVDAKLRSLAVNHRQSTRFETSNYHVLAWLMLGEAAARQRRYPPYRKELFQQAVREIRTLTVLEPEQFGPLMVEKAANAGVAVVFEPPLSKTCLYGSARWIDGERPIIQMSLRMKTNDHFWWTFFHECAHILLHQGMTFADDQNGVGDGLEDEADRWAEEALVGRNQFARFKATRPRSELEVRAFARSVEIHPGIVVGMLQHARVLPFANLNGLKVSLRFANG